MLRIVWPYNISQITYVFLVFLWLLKAECGNGKCRILRSLMAMMIIQVNAVDMLMQ